MRHNWGLCSIIEIIGKLLFTYSFILINFRRSSVMIEVNIWLSTAFLFKKRIKHKFFGPLLASEDKGENVGHVNFTIEIDERTKIVLILLKNTGLSWGLKKHCVPSQLKRLNLP